MDRELSSLQIAKLSDDLDVSPKIAHKLNVYSSNQALNKLRKLEKLKRVMKRAHTTAIRRRIGKIKPKKIYDGRLLDSPHLVVKSINKESLYDRAELLIAQERRSSSKKKPSHEEILTQMRKHAITHGRLKSLLKTSDVHVALTKYPYNHIDKLLGVKPGSYLKKNGTKFTVKERHPIDKNKVYDDRNILGGLKEISNRDLKRRIRRTVNLSKPEFVMKPTQSRKKEHPQYHTENKTQKESREDMPKEAKETTQERGRVLQRKRDKRETNRKRAMSEVEHKADGITLV